MSKKHLISLECPRCGEKVTMLEEVAPGLYTMPDVFPDETVCKLEPLRKKLHNAIRDYGQAMYNIGAAGGVGGDKLLDEQVTKTFNKILKLLGGWAKVPKGKKK